MSSDKYIIDVREPHEFELGHVEGALNIPIEQIVSGSDELSAIPTDSEVIVYCNSGSRSGLAINYLSQQGYQNVANGINQFHIESKGLDS